MAEAAEAAPFTVRGFHNDLVHDIAFDFYGKRLATCSSDHSVKVWDIQPDGTWLLSGEMKAHRGSVWKVTWAHPEFGQVLATCSFDHTVIIFEEKVAGGKTGVWEKRAELPDSRAAVTDVKFAPRHLGLKLAACSEDYMVRTYEAMDIMNLSSWPQLEDFKVQGKGKCTCLSWSPSRLHAPTIAVGCGGTEQGANNVQVWVLEESRRWAIALETLGDFMDPVRDVVFAPNMGRSFHNLAAASSDKTVRVWRLTPEASQGPRQKLTSEELLRANDHGDQVWRVSWNVTGTVLASSGEDGSVRLWKATHLGHWECVSVIKGELPPH
eukprot:m.75543 g.75543  ORF g.75543 m.75543 type:complete len:324 (+) comp14485_c0_seq1:2496-3467(+)